MVVAVALVKERRAVAAHERALCHTVLTSPHIVQYGAIHGRIAIERECFLCIIAVCANGVGAVTVVEQGGAVLQHKRPVVELVVQCVDHLVRLERVLHVHYAEDDVCVLWGAIIVHPIVVVKIIIATVMCNVGNRDLHHVQLCHIRDNRAQLYLLFFGERVVGVVVELYGNGCDVRCGDRVDGW